MNTKDIIKQLFISIYKLIMYTVVMLTFTGVFSLRYSGLTYVTRTFVITHSTFVAAMLFMVQVYGNFEIGEKKSKPVIFSTFMNIVVTDIVALFSLKIMAIHEALPLNIDLLYLLAIILIQYVIIYIFTYFGNYLYFKLFKPLKVMIVHNNSEYLPKIIKYLNRHKKQFSIISTIDSEELPNINYSIIDQVYLLDMSYEVLHIACQDSFMSTASIFYSTEISNALGGSRNRQVIDDVLIYEFSSTKMTLTQMFWKRAIDIFISLIALIISSPIFLIVAIAIKTDDNGPIIFKQKRLTRDGRVFEIYKFRSMKENVSEQPASVNDERITRVGKYLRKLRIDEIPQFLNILKGDMSVVGPRPESSYLNDGILDELPQFAFRLKVKAGLTGYAQIFGKYNTNPKSKLLLDLEYIENYTILSDIKLILQTFTVFVKKDSTEGFDNENTIH